MQRQKRDGFVMLPRWLVQSEILTKNDREFCLFLAFHRNGKTKRCYPKRLTLCREIGMHENTYYKIRKNLKEIGLISYEDSPGGRKKSVEFKLNWLDGSNEDIAKIKKDLKQKKPVQNNTGLTTTKRHRFNYHKKAQANLCGNVEKLPQKGTQNYKEVNKINSNNNKDFAVVDFSLSEETIKILKSYGLSDSKIRELINLCPDSDKTKYFSNWLAFIERNPKDNPGGFLIRMVEKKQNFPVNHSELKTWRKQKIDELLQKAKQDLEKLPSVDRILEWLVKLPDDQHGELEVWYKQKYPKGKFWTPAEVKYYQSKKENQDQWNKPLETDEEVSRRLKIIKRKRYANKGKIA